MITPGSSASRSRSWCIWRCAHWANRNEQARASPRDSAAEPCPGTSRERTHFSRLDPHDHRAHQSRICARARGPDPGKRRQSAGDECAFVAIRNRARDFRRVNDRTGGVALRHSQSRDRTGNGEDRSRPGLVHCTFRHGFIDCARNLHANVATRENLNMKLPNLPPFDHQPKKYSGPSADEVLRLRKEFLNPGIFLYYKKPLMLVEGKMNYVG